VAPEISFGGNFSHDVKGGFYSTTTIYGYVKKSSTTESYKCLLAILNSNLCWWYLTKTGTVLANGFFRYKPNYLKPFPIPKIISSENETKLISLVDKAFVEKNKKEAAILNDLIDDIIYELYQLNPDEIKTIKSTC
jgi:hypothetical protein